MKITDGLHGFIWESMVENNCNSYLIDGNRKILIDPGHLHLFEHVKKELDTLGIGLDDIHAVLVTHPHPDHIEAVQAFMDRPADVAFHEEGWTLIQAMGDQFKAAMGLDAADVAPDFFLREGALRIDDKPFEVYHTPGHSPGSVAIYWPEKKALFTGDVIFPQGLGRTDLPGGDSALLKDSIRRLSKLEVAYLCAGHGEVIRGAAAVKKNFEEVMNYWFRYL